jgi:hypothetical protein
MNPRVRRRLFQTLLPIGFGVALLTVESLLWSRREALGNLLWWLQLPLGLMTFSIILLTCKDDLAEESPVALRPASIAAGDEITEVRAELHRMAERIEERDRDLTERLKTFHEWLEFPRPLNLTDTGERPSDPEQHGEQDRELFSLLETESRSVFDRILTGAYTDEEGRVRAAQIRDETVDFIRRIARIYRPNDPDPLLHTSMARILHAASRATLQSLVVLEDLPVAVKDHSLQDIYDYIQKGVNAYGVYKRFEPYKPYVDTAYYLGRFALGASPLSLGAWWLVGALGQKGLRAATTHYLEGQALALLHNLIRVVGYEVAGLYGGDFRHRDPNWLYAVEVVELVHSFPESRRSLSRGLKEIGRLSLRSEYDRVYLYRALAAHQSVNPGRYDASILSVTERGKIAERLELLLHEDLPGGRTETIQEWRTGVEQRLNIKMRLSTSDIARRASEESARQAVRSLAGFLLEQRHLDAEPAAALLEGTRSATSLSANSWESSRAALVADPPFFFEPPDLDPEEASTDRYLEDLVALAVEVPPFPRDTRTLITEVATFLRQNPATVARRLDSALVTRSARNLSAFQPDHQITPSIAEALVAGIPKDDPIRFVYADIDTDPPIETEGLFLCATDMACTLRSSNRPEVILWNCDESARARQNTTLGRGHCAVSGGKWHDGGDRLIRIGLPLFSGYAAHFRALLERIEPIT